MLKGLKKDRLAKSVELFAEKANGEFFLVNSVRTS